MVIALAGRRIDSPSAEQRHFPTENALNVKRKIAEFFRAHDVEAVVCAAACGADILALEAAGEHGIHQHIVLPFNHRCFRAKSVADRGGDWGFRYDQIIAKVAAAGDLVQKTHNPDDQQTWQAGNLDILDEAQTLADGIKSELVALVVWDGSRGEDDITGHFKTEAQKRGLRIAEDIPTL